MKVSALVQRVAGEGAAAWRTHYAAVAALERGEDVIILSVGDPDLPTPQPVIEEAVAKLRAGDTHYTPARGRLALREAIAASHLRRTGQAVDADHVIVLCGAQNALYVAAQCLAGPGDEVLSFDPMYPTYPATIESSGARMVRVPLRARNSFRLDLQDLAAAITPHTRAVFLATPGNPTGVIQDAATMAGLGELARRHSLWIVADEVYAGLAPGGRVPGLAATLPEQVVTISSLSKSHAMPGWRAGWMVAPKTLIRHAEDLTMCMLFGLPGFIQDAAVTALGLATQAEARIRDYCEQRSRVMLRELGNIPGIDVIAPQAGMFLLLDVRKTGLSSAEFVSELYRLHGVSVMDGNAFGLETDGFVRLCFATEESVIVEACRRLRSFCHNAQKSAR
jgi:arginine:pyruvate transaminase